MKLGREGYVFSLVVTSSLLAVVAVPAWLQVLGTRGPGDREVLPGPARPGDAAAPRALERRGAALPVASRRGGAALTAAGLALLALHGAALVAVGVVPLLALVVTTLVALAIGHALGGPDPDDRTALAVSCATRHVGIAMLAASTVPGPRVAVLVLAYVLASAVVSIPYLRWRKNARASRGRS